MSVKRFTQLVKHYLPKGNIVIGISNEEYVVGFENQPQFRMLKRSDIQSVVDKVMTSSSPNKVFVFTYSQNDLDAVVGKLTSSQRILLVNGSWKYTFHNLPAYKILTKNNVPIKFISPFVDENEAKAYEESHTPFIELPARGTLLDGQEMFDAAEKASLQSYDYSFQTGAAIGKAFDGKYEIIATAFNKVIPYQTYALHHGNSREKNLSRPHDTNHYDTVHSEMTFLIEAARGDYDIEDATLFINLLPCPNCARTLSQTNIDGIIYLNDHSGGYAKNLLQLCGKKVTRIS
jgi:deoxycytidylate deaminase